VPGPSKKRPPPTAKPPKPSAVGVPRPEMIIGAPIAYKPKTPKPFTPELAEEILERLASPESLRNICREERMPSRTVVYEWAVKDPVFGARLRIAQKHQAAAMMDQGLAILDAATPETAYLAKNQFDARRIYASKLDRDNFGDQSTTKLIGDANQPVAFVEVDPDKRLEVFMAFLARSQRESTLLEAKEFEPPHRQGMPDAEWDQYVQTIAETPKDTEPREMTQLQRQAWLREHGN
jgi:hypothetical protein